MFYVARQCARLGELDTALRLLDQATDRGFHCQPVLAADPWLDAVRPTSGFRRVLERVEKARRQALAAFLEADGERLLGLSVSA